MVSLGSFMGGASSLVSGGYKSGKNKASTSETQKAWSDRVQQAVEDKFLNSLAEIDYGNTTGLVDAIAQKAYDYGIDVDPIIAEARRKAEIETGQNYQSLTRQAGSDANSLVALAQNEAILDRENNLASLRAQLEAQNQQGQLDALAIALDANNQSNTSILNLGSLLKGAQMTGTSLTKGRQSEWGVNFGGQKQGQGQF